MTQSSFQDGSAKPAARDAADTSVAPDISLDSTLDDVVTVFSLDGKPVRGRAIHAGAAIDAALKGPDGAERYPPLVARMLGEAMMVGALVAKALKFDGRLIVQCHGTNEGAISLLVADCHTDGSIRGYARWDDAMLKEVTLDNRNPGADALLGRGTFSMTIDQGVHMDQYQGLAPIEGTTLGECAQSYFVQSEQIPTRVKMALGRVQGADGPEMWRGGAIMIQKIADDAARGDTLDAWTTAETLLETVTDAELIDPDLSQNRLLFRLFHEEGVKVIAQGGVRANCKCSRERLEATLRSFPVEELRDTAEDGKLEATCEFCGVEYVFEVESLSEE